MELPPSIENRVEANVIFALAHKLARTNMPNDDGSTSDLFNGSPPGVAPPEVGSEANKRPLPEPEHLTKVRICRPPCSLPNANDPIDGSFYMKLYTAEDEGKINPMHNVIRRLVLDVCRTMSGKIFFQCTCCKHLPRCERAKCSTVAPQSIGSLYRAMIRFMMYHVSECEHIPKQIKGMSSDVKVCGTKDYWRKSAEKIGLRDGDDGMSIVYRHPTE